MGTTHQLTDHRSFTRIAITFLATLALLISQLAFLPGSPALAEESDWRLGGQVTLPDYAGGADQVWLSGTASKGNIGGSNGQDTCAEIATLQGLDPADVRFASPRSGNWNTSGTESIGGGTITQTVAADGRYWVWEAQGIEILAAFSKGGPAFHTFIYDPAATSDVVNPIAPGGLVSPGTAGLSHSAFCWLDAPARSPQIDLVKATDAGLVEPGDAFTYTVTATSTGDATATDVTVTDPVPAPFVVESASYQVDEGAEAECATDGDVSCGPVDLPVDSVMVVTIDVSVPGELSDDACVVTTNIATAVADGIRVSSNPVDVEVRCPDDPEPGVALTVEKMWDGDADLVDLAEVSVTFQVSVNDTEPFPYTPGESEPIQLQPGDEVELTEQVAGLPELCSSYEHSKLSYTAPSFEDWDTDAQDAGLLQDTFTVTNTLDCDPPFSFDLLGPGTACEGDVPFLTIRGDIDIDALFGPEEDRVFDLFWVEIFERVAPEDVDLDDPSLVTNEDGEPVRDADGNYLYGEVKSAETTRVNLDDPDLRRSSETGDILVLWPGAAVDGDGNGIRWPNWEPIFADPSDTSSGIVGWLQVDDGFDWARAEAGSNELGVFAVINPTTSLEFVGYPPPTEVCADPALEPAIDLVKTATDADVPFEVVDGLLILDVTEQESATVTYEFVITNVGNQPLLEVALTDDKIGVIDVPVEVLGIGDSVTVTATYDVTGGDIDAGFVANVGITTAVAQGSGEPVEATDDEVIAVVEVLDVVLEPGIEVVKEALIDVDEDGLKTVTVGDDGTAEIVYRYTITNTGDAQLFNVTLTDDVIGDLTDELSVTFLAVGESTVVEVPYTTTAAELAAGRVDNIATTTGTTVEGATAEAQDDETVFLVEVLDTVEPLPKTGADTWLLTAVGLLLTLLGAATLLLGTRRRQHGEA